MRFRLIALCAWTLGLIPVAPVAAQETALAGLRAEAKQAPTDVAVQTKLGRALIEAGRLPEAEAQMRAVERLSKGSVEGMFEIMRVKFATDEFRQAKSGCRDLSVKAPTHVLTHLCMARAFLIWRRASRAFEHLDQALALEPEHPEVLLALGDAKRMQGDFPGAKAAYDKLLATGPVTDAYLGLGLVEVVQNHTAEAIAALKQAHALDPQDPDVQLELGKRLSGPESVALLRAALAGRPRWAEAELELAIAQLRAGDSTGAEAALRAVRKRLPDNRIAVAEHAAALVALGRHAEAEPELKRALELLPNHYGAALALARLYEQTGRTEEAFTQYRYASDQKRESPEALIAAAKLGLSLQRPMLAGALLEKALARSPRSAEALALYAEVLISRNDSKAAKEHLTRALSGEGPFDRAAVQKRLAELK